jgi:excisionase family DNA binding protein
MLSSETAEAEMGVTQILEPMIGPAEVAAAFGISERQVVRLALRGELPGVKMGKLWRFRASDIDRTISQKIKSNRPAGQEGNLS